MQNLKKGGAGVTILIIVVLLILAGVLFYSNRQDAAPIEEGDAVVEDGTMATGTPAVEGESTTTVEVDAEVSAEVDGTVPAAN